MRGEVNRIGLYELGYDENYSTNNIKSISNFESYNDLLSTENTNFDNPSSLINKPPRLFDLIKKGNGFSNKADLSNIEIVRNNPESQGGGKIKANINLISLIKDGDQSQNIVLRDGDDILVKKSNLILLDQISVVNRSNLTPDFVEIYLNGNIFKPGPLVIRQGASLNQAIASVGGLANLSGKIEFIRLTRNGKHKKKLITFNPNAMKGSKDNPVLVQGDIIFVRKSLFGKTAEIINDYTTPFVNAYGVYKLFD